jgi:hypothetical protein
MSDTTKLPSTRISIDASEISALLSGTIPETILIKCRYAQLRCEIGGGKWGKIATASDMAKELNSANKLAEGDNYNWNED